MAPSSPVSPPGNRDLLPAWPRPLLGDKVELEVQVSRGRFAAFWLDLLLFSEDKAAGGSRGERSRRGGSGAHAIAAVFSLGVPDDALFWGRSQARPWATSQHVGPG